MIKDQKGNIQMLVVLLIIITGLILAVYLVQQKTNIFPKAAVPTPTYQTQTPRPTSAGIQNDNDLMRASSDLDNTNIDIIDSELDKNDSDLSTF